MDGTLLSGAFGSQKLIHIGLIVKALWEQLDFIFPENFNPLKKAILRDAKEQHPAFAQYVDEKSGSIRSKRP